MASLPELLRAAQQIWPYGIDALLVSYLIDDVRTNVFVVNCKDVNLVFQKRIFATTVIEC